MSMYTKQAIPASAIPRIAHCTRIDSSGPLDWIFECRIATKVVAECRRQGEIAASRMRSRPPQIQIGMQMQRAAVRRWGKLLDALIPVSSGAGDHDASASIKRGISEPEYAYDTYRGAAPCKSYGHGTSCSTATISLPVGWEIADEDHATVARRARWHARTLEQRQERYIIRQRGSYGLKLVPGWYISGYHIEIADRRKAMRAAREMSAARRIAQVGERIAMRIYGREIMGIADSIAAGNCRTGSEGWARKHFGSRAEATIAEVLRAARVSGERRAELAARMAMRRAERELASLALLSAVA